MLVLGSTGVPSEKYNCPAHFKAMHDEITPQIKMLPIVRNGLTQPPQQTTNPAYSTCDAFLKTNDDSDIF